MTTLATLILELSLTRIFSVIFHYHLAFLAVSIALFGLGAGGVLSYLVGGPKQTVFQRLGILSTANAVAVLGSLMFLLSRNTDAGNLTLAAVYFASALPFVISGTIVALAINETVERIDKVYFFDLIGAAGGCLLLVPFLNSLGGPNTVIAAGVLFAAAGAIWFHMAGRIQGRAGAVLVALALTSLVIINFKNPIVEIQFAKGQKLPKESFTKWNSFSRIALVPEKGWIVIDADASTGIPHYDYDNLTADEKFGLLTSGPALPYRLRPGSKTLIIGAGGGFDVARALASGSKDITAVEINPIIANTIMQKQFPQLSNYLYTKRPEVRLVVEDGRAFVRRSNEKYQVIQATLVDTWASTAAGAFALTENNLYTTDAFYDYLTHLTDDGILAFTRWGFEPPRESLRLISLAREALNRLGEKETWRHVIVARENTQQLAGWGATDTVIISRKPMNPATAAPKISLAVGNAQLQQIYFPGLPFPSTFSEYLAAEDVQKFYDQYPYDITPVDDNKPFFFYTVQPRDVLKFLSSAGRDSADFKINRAVPVLFGLVGISIVATLIVIALPPLLLGTRLPTERGLRRYLLYFVAIGVGYILIQIALIQKFVLFLGHPVYALTVIIFSMLVSSGLGSYFSRHLIGGSRERWLRVLFLVAGLVVVLAFVTGPITGYGVGWPRWVKLPLSALLIAPAGFFMGMPFPTGLGYLEKRHAPSVRWAWSLNAAASVMGSAVSMFAALYLGLLQTLLVGAGMYLVAGAILALEPKSAPVAGE
ncbi:MAG: hypothetical protein JNK87_39150 [Bryobacterales bacterium]|nr:hypothetical protein [Bryobacterales bacterium]